MDNWQDIVIAIGSLILAVSLVPSVLGKDKPAFSTSITTGTVLLVFTVTYASLSLWYATLMTSIATMLWFTLAIQQLLRKNIDRQMTKIQRKKVPKIKK